MKPNIALVFAVSLALAGCATPSRQTHVTPKWEDIKGMTVSEIAGHLYQAGDQTFVQIYTAQKLLEERKALLAGNPSEEAKAEVTRIDGHLKALKEHALREAKQRFDYAFAAATEKRN